MHAGYDDRGQARIKGFAPLTMQLEGYEEGVGRDHDGAERDALIVAFREGRQLAQHDPDEGADESGGRQQWSPMEEPHAVPNHAASEERERLRELLWNCEQRRRRGPERD